MKMLPLLAIVTIGSVSACGQKGPLVLPDAQHPHKKIGLPKPQKAPTPAPTPPQSPTSQPTPAPANPTSPQQ